MSGCHSSQNVTCGDFNCIFNLTFVKFLVMAISSSNREPREYYQNLLLILGLENQVVDENSFTENKFCSLLFSACSGSKTGVVY